MLFVGSRLNGDFCHVCRGHQKHHFCRVVSEERISDMQNQEFPMAVTFIVGSR
jgi:hypothetical protein